MDTTIKTALNDIISRALKEDVGEGDVTSQRTIPKGTFARGKIVAKEALVLCGVQAISDTYQQLNADIVVKARVKDSEKIGAGEVIAELEGDAIAMLTGERVMLNLLQRMSGVATLTHNYAKKLAGTKAQLLDTRKTMPGLRLLDKYAVTQGGGVNHRMALDDVIMIKDNHIAVAGGLAQAIAAARVGEAKPIIVECDTIEQVQEALALQPDRILLDNMSLATLKEAVVLSAGKVALEASGGVTLESIKAIAQTGVDSISVGAITHSAVAVDIGLDISLD